MNLNMASVYTKITMRTGFEIQRLVLRLYFILSIKNLHFNIMVKWRLLVEIFHSGSLGISALNEADIPTQELYDQFDNRDLRKRLILKQSSLILKPVKY